jgi:hypothetical protein
MSTQHRPLRPDGDPGSGSDLVHLRLDHLAFVRLSGCNLDVENDADLIIDGRVPLVSGFQPSVASVRGHCGVGIGCADLRVLAALPSFFLVLYLLHLPDMTLYKAVPAHVGADQRCVDVHDLSCGDFRVQVGLHGALEDFAEPLFAPALANAR